MPEWRRIRSAGWQIAVAVLIAANAVLASRSLSSMKARAGIKTAWGRVLAKARPLAANGAAWIPRYPAVVVVGGTVDAESLMALEEAGSACASCSFLFTPNVRGIGPLHDSALGWRTFLTMAAAHELPTRYAPRPVAFDDWLVVDSDGLIRAQGALGDRGIEGALGGILGTRPPLSPHVIADGLRALSSRSEGLQPYAALAATSRPQEHSTLFVNTASASCWTGSVVARLSGALRGYAEVPGLSISVPADWNAEETEAFRATFGVQQPVFAVSPQIQTLWKAWQRRYGVGAVAVFLVTFTTNGVRRVAIGGDLLSAVARRPGS